MSTYQTPAEQPHHTLLGRLIEPAATKLGHRALQAMGVSLAFLVAMMIGEGIGQAVYGSNDPTGWAADLITAAFLVGVVGVFAFLAIGVIAAWGAVLWKGERAPGVFVAALILPVVVLSNTPVVYVAAMILMAAVVLNEVLRNGWR